jgi:hypothetical protein
MVIEYLDLFDFNDELFDYECNVSSVTPLKCSSGAELFHYNGDLAPRENTDEIRAASDAGDNVHHDGTAKVRKKRKSLGVNRMTRTSDIDHITDRKLQRIRKVPPLLAFPSYDKCDSLIYFPHAMSRHLNTANFYDLSKLFSSHLDKRCQIEVFDSKHNWRMIVKLFECMNEIHPDSLMCVHSTKVVGNQITSVIHSKFTDCRKLVGALQNSATDQMFKSQLDDCSVDGVERRIAEEGLPEDEKQRRMGLLRTGVDVVVYLKSELVLTLDSLSKLVVDMTLRSTLSSVQPVVVDLATEDTAAGVEPKF